MDFNGSMFLFCTCNFFKIQLEIVIKILLPDAALENFKILDPLNI